ncbi:hypothetical protein [Natrarchaeobaculum sulfurireducens]|nr:hypothetical protein [Natrarchaeobaculum sulfurireducens]
MTLSDYVAKRYDTEVDPDTIEVIREELIPTEQLERANVDDLDSAGQERYEIYRYWQMILRGWEQAARGDR